MVVQNYFKFTAYKNDNPDDLDPILDGINQWMPPHSEFAMENRAFDDIAASSDWIEQSQHLVQFDYYAKQVVRDFKRLHQLSNKAFEGAKVKNDFQQAYLGVTANGNTPSASDVDKYFDDVEQGVRDTFKSDLSASADRDAALQAFQDLLKAIVTKRAEIIEKIQRQAKKNFADRLQLLSDLWNDPNNIPKAISQERADKVRGMIVEAQASVARFNADYAFTVGQNANSYRDYENYVSINPFEKIKVMNEELGLLEAHYQHVFKLNDQAMTAPEHLISAFEKKDAIFLDYCGRFEKDFRDKHSQSLIPKGRQIIEKRLRVVGMSMSYDDILARVNDRKVKKETTAKLVADKNSLEIRSQESSDTALKAQCTQEIAAIDAKIKEIQDAIEKEDAEFKTKSGTTWSGFHKEFLSSQFELEKNIPSLRFSKWLMGYHPDSLDKQVSLYSAPGVLETEAVIREKTMEGLRLLFADENVNMPWFDEGFTAKVFKVEETLATEGVTLSSLVRDDAGQFSWGKVLQNLEDKKIERIAFTQVERLNDLQKPRGIPSDYGLLSKAFLESNDMSAKQIQKLETLLKKDGNIDTLDKAFIQSDKILEATDSLSKPGVQWNAVSINGLLRGWDLIKSWAERRLNMYLDLDHAVFGKELLANVDDTLLNKALGGKVKNIYSDFNRKKESTEASEVSVYQGDYGNKDMSDVWDITLSAQNMYEFKACLNLLAAKGRINWYEPALIEKIKEFTGNAYEIPADPSIMLGDTAKFQANLNAAFSSMYDRDTYNSWRNQNLSAFESEMGTMKNTLDQISNTPQGLRGYLDGLIVEAKANLARSPYRAISKDVNPVVYQAAVNYAIDTGKMGAEEKMYYFMLGLALGILPPDRGPITADKYAPSIYPCFEWFTQPTENGPKPGPKDFEKFKDMVYSPDFLKWFHLNIMPLGATTTRLTKTLTQRGFAYDHDDAHALVGWSEPEGIKAMLLARGHGAMGVPPVTGLDNTALGLNHVLDTIGNEYDSFKSKYGADRTKNLLINTLDSNGLFYAITRQKSHADTGKAFVIPDATFNNKARSDGAFSGVYGRQGLTTGGYMDASKEYLCMVDPTLFEPFFEGAYLNRTVFREKMEDFFMRYETNVQDVYGKPSLDNLSLNDFSENISKVIHIIDKKDPTKLQAIIDKIQADTKERLS